MCEVGCQTCGDRFSVDFMCGSDCVAECAGVLVSVFVSEALQ